MKKNILIIEDEKSIAEAIQYPLDVEGFHTVHSTSGLDALSILTKKKIDLIILDIGLPDINGFELLKNLRKQSNIPVIILSARSDEIDRVVGLEIGADDYIVKPFSPRELTARVKAVLRRITNTSSSENLNNPFQIDEAKCLISYCQKNLILSKYEFLLLKTFIQRPGVVFTRDQLMELVWEEPESAMDRTIDAHIKNIRNKLKQINSNFDPIVTHRGIGYALREKLWD